MAFNVAGMTTVGALSPIFRDEFDFAQWQKRILKNRIPVAVLQPHTNLSAYLGIDSGSTTTKIVVLNAQGEMIFDYYHTNDGNPIHAVEEGLGCCKINSTNRIAPCKL